jgi:pyruvate dehydrogenase E1 component
LGTDGFGRSDTRENLRRFFEIDASMVVLATLSSLAAKGTIGKSVPARAINELGINPEKAHPVLV